VTYSYEVMGTTYTGSRISFGGDSTSFEDVRTALMSIGLPNQRLKLSECGARLKGNGLVLIAAAAPRSLSAIR
jgi:hypothetical protein